MGLGAPRQPMELGAAIDKLGEPRKLMGLGDSWMVLRSRLAVKNLPSFLRESWMVLQSHLAVKNLPTLRERWMVLWCCLAMKNLPGFLRLILKGTYSGFFIKYEFRLLDDSLSYDLLCSAKKLLSHNKFYLFVDLDYTLLNSTDLNQMTMGEEYLRSQTYSTSLIRFCLL
ncbi:hypothetical protein ACFX16_008396 [Malus domestica]